jgi:hypothetical protein
MLPPASGNLPRQTTGSIGKLSLASSKDGGRASFVPEFPSMSERKTGNDPKWIVN